MSERDPRDAVNFSVWSPDPPVRTARIVGESASTLWGLTPRERIARIAARRGVNVLDEKSDEEPDLLINGRYAFEPGLFDWTARDCGRAVEQDGHLVLVRPSQSDRAECTKAMEADRPAWGDLRSRLRFSPPVISFEELAKVEAPLVVRLSNANAAHAAKACFAAAYRGVTDLLTKFVWRMPALFLVRAAVSLKIKPDFITLAGICSCVLAGLFWWHGAFVPGLGCVLLFSLLDTVDGKLARCTVTSSRLGDVLDRGTDLLCPPLLWLCWARGALIGGYLSDDQYVSSVVIMTGSYLAQRMVEAAFVTSFGFQIHYWQRFDALFKLVTSQRNTQVLLLGASFAAHDAALALAVIEIWAMACVMIHALRLAQAFGESARDRPVESFVVGNSGHRALQTKSARSFVERIIDSKVLHAHRPTDAKLC